MSEADSNFLSRWSRRKAEVREGAGLTETVVRGPLAPLPPVPVAGPGEHAAVAQVPPGAAATPTPPPPTLADVAALNTQSDYTRFVSRDVAPEVKQAALKKLFTDPHFNVMDGLDTYIDDYGKPDPLPPGMLRQMMQSQLLGLFDHEKKAEGADASPDPADSADPADPADTPERAAHDEPAADAEPPTSPNPPEP